MSCVQVNRDATLLPEDKAKRYSVLHKQYADKVLGVILRLRGYYVKMGQISAQFPEMIPEEWLDNMRCVCVTCMLSLCFVLRLERRLTMP